MEERSVSRNPVLEGPVRTVAVVKVNEEWGVATHLGGLLSSVTLFSDVIPGATIKTIYHYGKHRTNIKLSGSDCIWTGCSWLTKRASLLQPKLETRMA